MKYRFILVLIIILFLIILSSPTIEHFQSACSEETCKSPKLWINGTCFNACSKNMVPASNIIIGCVYLNDKGEPTYYTIDYSKLSVILLQGLKETMNKLEETTNKLSEQILYTNKLYIFIFCAALK